MSNKVAVFGVDGGVLSLIEQWKDELPVFRRFLENGSYGTMKSTIPALTCPAWACMFTGKNPAKLGIYDFLSLDLRNGQSRITSSDDYHDSALWKILSDKGKSVGMLNIPITYPAHDVNGYMVCGLGTPEISGVDYTYPIELRQEIDDKIGGYKITPNVLITLYGQEKKCLLETQSILKKRVQTAKYLIKNYPTDFFACVFFVSDVMQHYFWHYMDKTHPRYTNSPYTNAIKDTYKSIDNAIGELINCLPEDTNIILTSDHAFGACYGGLSINRWLEKMGYLKYKEGTKNRNGIYKLRDFALSHSSSRLIDFIAKNAPRKIINRLTTSGEAKDIVRVLLETVDWANTKAYVLGTSGGGIFVNLRGRQPFGIVKDNSEYEEVRSSLICDLAEIGLKAYRREEIYSGQYLEYAPDVAIELGSSNYYPTTLDRNSVYINYAASGAHTMDAMFLALGNDVNKCGRLPELSIYDVTPTVLKLMGVSIPEDVDGKVLNAIIGGECG